MNRSVRPVLAVALLVPIGLGLLVSWFAWPAREIEPRDLPVVVAGPSAVTAPLAAKLGAAAPGAFEVTVLADAAAADDALRNREAYAAFVVGPTGLSLHTASGASPTVAAALTQAAQQLGGGATVSVVDVVPGTADDPRGAGFASGFLPLVMASLVAGILLFFLVPRSSGARWLRMAGLVGFALVGGLVGSGVLTALGIVAGAYLACAAVIALTALAIGGAVLGLGALLGRPGVALTVLVVFLFGVPISAVAAAPELLPQPWGAIGQWLPAGASGSLLRSAAFFDGAGAAAPLWTLVGWAAVGLALLAVGRAGAGPAHAATASAGVADAEPSPGRVAA